MSKVDLLSIPAGDRLNGLFWPRPSKLESAIVIKRSTMIVDEPRDLIDPNARLKPTRRAQESRINPVVMDCVMLEVQWAFNHRIQKEKGVVYS